MRRLRWRDLVVGILGALSCWAFAFGAFLVDALSRGFLPSEAADDPTFMGLLGAFLALAGFLVLGVAVWSARRPRDA